MGHVIIVTIFLLMSLSITARLKSWIEGLVKTSNPVYLSANTQSEINKLAFNRQQIQNEISALNNQKMVLIRQRNDLAKDVQILKRGLRSWKNIQAVLMLMAIFFVGTFGISSAALLFGHH
jgi:peptidoglycan hydrolase CwlO-like protein